MIDWKDLFKLGIKIKPKKMDKDWGTEGFFVQYEEAYVGFNLNLS